MDDTSTAHLFYLDYVFVKFQIPYVLFLHKLPTPLHSMENDTTLFRLADITTTPKNQLDVLETMAESLLGVDDVTKVRLLRSVQVREMSASTYMKNGLALPHARMEDIDHISVTAAYFPQGIDWPSADQKATFVVLLAIPHTHVQTYLVFLKKLMSWYRDIPLDKQAEILSDQNELEKHFKGML